MDMEEDIMATVSEASCGPGVTWTPSSPPVAKEDAMEPKALDDGRIQRAAMDKS